MESNLAHWPSPINTWSLKTHMLVCAQLYIKLHYSQARKPDRHNLTLGEAWLQDTNCACFLNMLLKSESVV